MVERSCSKNGRKERREKERKERRGKGKREGKERGRKEVLCPGLGYVGKYQGTLLLWVPAPSPQPCSRELLQEAVDFTILIKKFIAINSI